MYLEGKREEFRLARSAEYLVSNSRSPHEHGRGPRCVSDRAIPSSPKSTECIRGEKKVSGNSVNQQLSRNLSQGPTLGSEPSRNRALPWILTNATECSGQRPAVSLPRFREGTPKMFRLATYRLY